MDLPFNTMRFLFLNLYRDRDMLTYLFSLTYLLLTCSAQTPTQGSAKGVDKGLHGMTVYWLAQETKHDRKIARRSVRLRWRRSNRVYTRVSKRFARDLLMQGSGMLYNKQLVQYAGRCGRQSRLRCMRVTVLNRRRFPMSKGAMGRALIPFRSLAVDTRKIPLGSRVYIPQLGKLLSRRGYRHDGCFVAHDRGGRIQGNRIDLFVGLPRLFYRRLGRHMPRYARLYLKHSACRSKP